MAQDMIGSRIAEKDMLMQTSIVDPVCWMDVAVKSIAGKSEYEGQTYYFCSTGCKEVFDNDPQTYTSEDQENESKVE